MSKIIELLLNIVYSGLTFFKRINSKKELDRALLLGLAHMEIARECKRYIRRGWLSHEEYEDLNDYLYEPYTKCGGNGSGERLMNEVKKLPIREYGWNLKKENENDK